MFVEKPVANLRRDVAADLRSFFKKRYVDSGLFQSLRDAEPRNAAADHTYAFVHLSCRRRSVRLLRDASLFKYELGKCIDENRRIVQAERDLELLDAG